MNVIGLLLAVGLATSFFGILFLLNAAGRGQLWVGAQAAFTVFGRRGIPSVEDPSATGAQRDALAAEVGVPLASDVDPDVRVRALADFSSRRPVMLLMGSAAFWLVVGSAFGLIASGKLHAPDWLAGTAALTFGRVRPMHLNAVAYGWLSMAGMASAVWLAPRLVRTFLRAPSLAIAGAHLWNVGMVLGLGALALGFSDGTEWLEFPWQVDILFVAAGSLVGVPVLWTLFRSNARHLYVSVWYLAAAFVWFPILFLVGNLPWVHSGIEGAAVNWWFAHNVLGLWFTPLALAAAYYLIPKIIGRPIHSYQLSLLGFWALALFYSQVGIHHLIGGPVPTWLVTLSIVMSVMMVIPVVAVAVNHHFTMFGAWRALKHSRALRFVVLGAMLYTVASVQGSLHSLRTLNTITHFTHYTVAHAHVGAYGFASLVLFGAAYFLVPKVSGKRWPMPRLIDVHFWLVAVGFFVYVVFLSIGGVLQGLAMLDETQPFIASVVVTRPYLIARTVGGALMTGGHLVFAFHLWRLVRQPAPMTQEFTDGVPDDEEVAALLRDIDGAPLEEKTS